MKHSYFIPYEIQSYEWPCIFHALGYDKDKDIYTGEMLFTDGINDGFDYFPKTQLDNVPRFYHFKQAAIFCENAFEELGLYNE